MLTAEEVSYTLGENSPNALHFNSFSLSVDRGEIVVILGKSGTGKSTLLKILSGAIKPIGEVWCNNEPLAQPDSPVGMVFQHYRNAVFPWLTVEQNILIGKHKTELHKRGHFSSVEEALSFLRIDKPLKQYPDHFSGGELQKLQIGRVLMSNVDFLLLDEPDTSLDLAFKEDLMQLLVSLASSNKCGIVLVTHSIDRAVYLANRTYLLKKEGQDVFVTPGEGFARKARFQEALDNQEYRRLFKWTRESLFGKS